MGRSLIAAAGSVPAVGERVCYATLIDDYLRAPAFAGGGDPVGARRAARASRDTLPVP